MSRSPSGAARPAVLVAALLSVLLTGTACSTVPTSSSPSAITQIPPRPDTDVDIDPLRPEAGASPEEIVRGFIDAAASPVRGHPVAAEHLTPGAAESWADDTTITVIESAYSTIATAPGTVTLTATLVGTVDERGIFSVDGDLLTREYTLEEIEGEWRIATPPDGLTILQPDFERLYDELAAYFLDPTGERLVPDPRYLIGGESQPTALVERLLDGPSPRLLAGVRNPIAGLELRGTVTVDGATATVDLTGVAAAAEPPVDEISAQLVYTLRRANVRSVRLLVDGERVPGRPSEQTVDDWASYAPDAVPVDTIGHYLDGGVLRTVPEGAPVPGPAGEGRYALVSAAATAPSGVDGAEAFVVAVRERDGGRDLLAGPYGGALAQITTGRSFTEPSVAAVRPEAWTVRDENQVIRVPAGGNAVEVVAGALPGLGSTTALQLSPDGVRAALVVVVRGGPSLYVGTVVRDDEGPVTLRDLREVTPSLTQVVDVAWQDSGHLLVLADDASEDQIVPYSVAVDGWGLDEISTAGLPAPPTSIAVAPTKAPLVSARDAIWQQSSGGTWETLVRGEPPSPGTRPFYPL